MTFRSKPEAEKRRSSAITLIKVLLADTSPEVLPAHVRELLDTLLWKITEADGKYNTRHQSVDALGCKDRTQLRHDHVYPKRKMLDALLAASPEEVDDILKDAVGCTVTLDEHLRLSRFDREHAGWDRYRRAVVAVWNTESGELEISADSE